MKAAAPLQASTDCDSTVSQVWEWEKTCITRLLTPSLLSHPQSPVLFACQSVLEHGQPWQPCNLFTNQAYALPLLRCAFNVCVFEGKALLVGVRNNPALNNFSHKIIQLALMLKVSIIISFCVTKLAKTKSCSFKFQIGLVSIRYKCATCAAACCQNEFLF